MTMGATYMEQNGNRFNRYMVECESNNGDFC